MLELPVPKRVSRQPKVTVCASFNRFLRETREAIEELQDLGAIVLSPKQAKPQVMLEGEFLLLEGDMKFPHDSIKEVEDRHLRAIRESDFVWIVCPGGYVGNSVALEIGYAMYFSIPMYSLCEPKIEGRIMKGLYVVEDIKTAVLNHMTPIL